MSPPALAEFLPLHAGAILKRMPIKTPFPYSVAADGLKRRQFLQGAAAGAAIPAWPLSSSAAVKRHVLATLLDTIEASNRCHTVPARQACG